MLQRYRDMNFTKSKLFIRLALSIPFKAGFNYSRHSHPQETGHCSDKQQASQQKKQGIKIMARIEFTETFGNGATIEAEVLFELGMMYATGRDCEMDYITAHKWFNVAAIKGSDRAAEMRKELTSSMSKFEIARALRSAREWMTLH